MAQAHEGAGSAWGSGRVLGGGRNKGKQADKHNISEKRLLLQCHNALRQTIRAIQVYADTLCHGIGLIGV